MEGEFMKIEDVIKLATDEFNTNGRSEKFIRMENAVLARKNPAEIYFFARYAKGSSVERLQNALIEKGALVESYYFQQNVEGADISKFTNLAITKGYRFWVNKFANLAEKTEQYDKIKNMIDGINTNIIPETIEGFGEETDKIIKFAKSEYKYHGRTPEFKEIEQFMLHNDAIANARLFMKHVPGINKKDFEYVALLRGEPFNMYVIALDVKGADRELMLRGLELAKLDYREVEKGLEEINRKRAKIVASLYNSERKGEPEYRARLLKSYNLLPKVPEYIAKIDNDYIATINYHIKHDNKVKVGIK